MAKKSEFVSRQAAADILGVYSPNLSAPWLAPRMPQPVKIEGAPPVYRRSEVEALAKELKKERAAKERRRQEKVKKEEAAA